MPPFMPEALASSSPVADDCPTGLMRQIALAKVGALQTAILTSASFSIIATDERGIIQLFNVGAERMLGHLAREVINRISPWEFHDPAEVQARAQALGLEFGTAVAPGFEALAFKALRGLEDNYELTYVRKDGSRFPAIVSVTSLRDDYGDVIGYLLIGTDNSQRKRAEAELFRATVAAEKANRAKSEFVSRMSHELRTPLNAILGFAQLMESGSPSPSESQQRSLQQILKAGWYLLELINEILDLAQIESGKLLLSQDPVALGAVLLECHAMMESQATDRDLTMDFAKLEKPCFVSADATRLKQVLINLLANAIKYNREGGSVSVSCERVAHERLRIRVCDTGVGLTPEQHAQLFQPFNRIGKEFGLEEGTGIGLVVSQRLVRLMGGTIGAHSTPGVGSEFWIELALAAAPRATAGRTPAKALAPARARKSAPRNTLLYVEDNPANLELVEQIIARRPDLRMVSATDGLAGVELARSREPDVILMDINLPGISGLEALKILRSDPATAHIPVIALSANAVPSAVASGLEAGFCDYLIKPVDVEELAAAVDAVLAVARP